MTNMQNSHGWALSAKHLGFRRIYFRKRKETLLFARTYVIRILLKSVNVCNWFLSINVNKGKNITVPNPCYQLIVSRKLTFEGVFFCVDLFSWNESFLLLFRWNLFSQKESKTSFFWNQFSQISLSSVNTRKFIYAKIYPIKIYHLTSWS